MKTSPEVCSEHIVNGRERDGSLIFLSEFSRSSLQRLNLLFLLLVAGNSCGSKENTKNRKNP